jgi:hypothetical protein
VKNGEKLAISDAPLLRRNRARIFGDDYESRNQVSSWYLTRSLGSSSKSSAFANKSVAIFLKHSAKRLVTAILRQTHTHLRLTPKIHRKHDPAFSRPELL